MQRDATLLKLAVITRVVKDDSWGCRTGKERLGRLQRLHRLLAYTSELTERSRTATNLAFLSGSAVVLLPSTLQIFGRTIRRDIADPAASDNLGGRPLVCL